MIAPDTEVPLTEVLAVVKETVVITGAVVCATELMQT
jgi:hypothetical protein